MIGIIVCGHSSFASGIYSAYELIAGACDHLKTIDFTIDDSIAMLEKKMNQAIDSLNDCDDILFMVDLLQGTPYFCAIKVAKQYPSKHINIKPYNPKNLTESNIFSYSSMFSISY